MLLTSELVSNALLHARSATGRGLLLIETMASAWGTEPVDGGKVVWFEAAERGDRYVDLSFHVPPDLAEAVVRFSQLLTAADDYCRHGELLTLAPPPQAVVFRNWYLGEFVAQIGGSDPTPWPEYRARGLQPT